MALSVFCEVVAVASLQCFVEFLNAIKSVQMKDTMVLVSVLLVLLMLLSLSGCSEMMQAFSTLSEAVDDAKGEIAGLALDIAGKVVGQAMDADAHAELVDQFIEQLGEGV